MKYIATGGGYRVPDYPFIEKYNIDGNEGSIQSSGTEAVLTPIDEGSTYKLKFLRFFYNGIPGDWVHILDNNRIRWNPELCFERLNESGFGDSTYIYIVRHGYDGSLINEEPNYLYGKQKKNAETIYTIEADWDSNNPDYVEDIGTNDLYNLNEWKVFNIGNARYFAFEYHPVPFISGGKFVIQVIREALRSATSANDLMFYPLNEGDFEPFSIINDGRGSFGYEIRGYSNGCLDLELVRIN